MPVKKYGIDKKRNFLKHPFADTPVKITRSVTLMAAIVLIGSFATAAPSTLRITIETFAPYYSPKIVHIGTGTIISWENPTSTLHSITHDGCKESENCAFDSGAIGPNRTFTVHHLSPGIYSYHCSFHPIMRGALVVLESDSSSET